MSDPVSLAAGAALDALTLFFGASFLLSLIALLWPTAPGDVAFREREARRRLLLPPAGALVVVALGFGSAWWSYQSQQPDHCGLAHYHQAWLCWLHPSGTVKTLSWLEVLVVLGLAGASLMVAAGVFRCWQDHRRLRMLEIVAQPALAAEAARTFEAQGLRWPGEIWVVPSDIPLCFVTGVRRARLVLSEVVLASMPPEALKAVVLHELSHVQRRDPLWRVIGQVAAMTHLPGIGHRAFRAWAFAIEAACDASSAKQLDSAIDIAEALVRFQRLVNAHPPSGPMPLWHASFGGTGALAARVKLLLSPPARLPFQDAVGVWPWLLLAVGVWQRDGLHLLLEAGLRLLHT